MKRVLLVIALVCNSALAFAADIATATGTFVDAARSRDIPYRVYYPSPLEKQYPVVIVSHGLGGSRDSYAMIGRHLAGHGFIAIHIQHAGSDTAIYAQGRDGGSARRAMQKAQSPTSAVDRFLDIPFVVAQLPKLNDTDATLKGHLNLQAIGMAGHSYGSISTMVAAGERMGETYASFKVPAIKAGVSLSPSPPRDGLDPERAYADISIPLFHITGTEDVNVVEGRDTKAADRLVPFTKLAVPNQYLLVLNKADHITFSGGRLGTRIEKKLDKDHMVAVLNGTLVFFQAYLMDNKSAEKWLRTEFKGTLGNEDRFEFK